MTVTIFQCRVRLRTDCRVVRKRTLLPYPTKVGRRFIAPSEVTHPLFGALKPRLTAML